MRNPFITKPVLFLALAGTAGCGINQLRVEYAQTVVTKGQAAATASRTFLDRVEDARQDLSIELIALDPECARARSSTRPDAPPGQLVSMVRVTPLLGPRAPERAWLCVPPGYRAAGSEVARGPLHPQFRSSLALIEALAAYAGALGEIVDKDAPDPAKAINDALGTALAVQDLIVAATGAEGGPLPAADDPRVSAVTGLIGFLTQLQHRSDQVRSLRQIVADSPGGANGVIAALQADVERWESNRLVDVAITTNINQLMMGRLVNRQPPATVEARRAALAALYARMRANEAGGQLAPAVLNLLTKVRQADDDFRRILQRDPHLNERESRRVAELNRQNVVAALQRITALITAFRGA